MSVHEQRKSQCLPPMAMKLITSLARALVDRVKGPCFERTLKLDDAFQDGSQGGIHAR